MLVKGYTWKSNPCILACPRYAAWGVQDLMADRRETSTTLLVEELDRVLLSVTGNDGANALSEVGAMVALFVLFATLTGVLLTGLR